MITLAVRLGEIFVSRLGKLHIYKVNDADISRNSLNFSFNVVYVYCKLMNVNEHDDRGHDGDHAEIVKLVLKTFLKNCVV